MKTKLLPSFCYPGRSRPTHGLGIHFISGIYVEPSNPFDIQVCWNLLHDLNLPKSGRKFYPDCGGIGRVYASYNELIGRNEDEDWLLVPYGKEVYHAGVSMHKGRPQCNQYMPAVALIATENSGYTDWQYRRLAEICADLIETYKFGRDDIVGHDKIRHNAKLAGLKNSDGSEPKDKLDPSGKADGSGDNFDWSRLHRMIDEIMI